MSGAIIKTMLEKGYEIYQLPDGTWAALITSGHLGHYALTAEKLSAIGLAGAFYGAIKHNMDWSLLPDVTKKVMIYCMPTPATIAIKVAIYIGGTWNLYHAPMSASAVFAARKLNPKMTLAVLGARLLSMFTRKPTRGPEILTSASDEALAAQGKEETKGRPGEALVIVDDHFADKATARSRRARTASSVAVEEHLIEDYCAP